MLNTQNIGIIVVASIITALFYFNDQPAEQSHFTQSPNYTKYIMIWVVCCSIGVGGNYFYSNGIPGSINQLGANLVDKNIKCEINKVSSTPTRDPAVIASLPDF
jgi:hypothetical protein